MQIVVAPGAGVTTVVRLGGFGSLLLNETQPARAAGTSNNNRRRVDMTDLPSRARVGRTPTRRRRRTTRSRS
ncbi:MAG: hypothetical protein E6Q40_02465 [Cupriavidus sp.]|nr:MAG: hypothetical protein E6Q40_02465 [Cupriavidus sp.]